MRLLLASLGLALAGCVSVTNSSPSRHASDAGEIRAATAGWVDAYNSRDPQRIVAYYAPDAVFWGTTSKTIRLNSAEYMDYFKDAAKRPDARVRVVDEHPRVWGDVGANTGSYVFSDVRDGQRTERAARFTMIFERRGGKWVLVEHHSSEVK